MLTTRGYPPRQVSQRLPALWVHFVAHLFTAAPLQPLNQVHNLDAKSVRDSLERLNRDVAFAAFYFSDMGTVQPRPVRKQILSPLVPESERPNFRPDLLLDVLHLPVVSRYSCFIHTGYNL